MIKAIPTELLRILTRLEERGWRAYIVGGCLRDMVMGRTPHDWDVASPALPEEVTGLFERTAPSGLKHGTVTIIADGLKVEHTTFRTEGSYSDRRRPDSVSFVPELGPDLARRDFTINAMAMGLDGELVDPFGGLGDIERRLIRAVGEPEARFDEDALRMLRALRFSAQLSFEIEAGTLAAIGKCSHLCAALAVERTAYETEEILLSDRPELALDALRLFYPGLEKTPGLAGIQNLRKVPAETGARWAALCALLTDAGAISSAAGFLSYLRRPSALIKNCRMAEGERLAGDAAGIKLTLSRIGPEACRAAAVMAVARGDGGALDWLDAVLDGGEPWSAGQLAVTGNDLVARGYSGREVGAELNKMLRRVIEDPAENTRDKLLGGLILNTD